MTNSFLLDTRLLVQLPVILGPPPSQLQQDIEFLAAQEVTRAFLNLERETAVVPSGHTVRCARMAIAPTSGPNGEIYSVYVSVVREPPREG